MRFRPLLVPTLITVPLLALALGLGVWQLERRAWKLGLIAEMQERLTAPPVSLSALERSARQGGAVAYRTVIVRGRFDHARAVLYYTLGPDGAPGYHVITPLMPDEGPPVLIDRGFVPEALKDPAVRAAGDPAGEITLRGIARTSQSPGLFTPAHQPGTNVVYARDVAAIAAEIGLAPVVPFFVEADATPNPGGYPLGGQTRVTLRNEHLGYALTWFGLALSLLIIYFLYHRSRARLGGGPGPAPAREGRDR